METSVRTPLQLWLVGALATVWNAFGAFDYLMTQTRNEAYLAGFTEEQQLYFDSFPTLMEAAWAFGVWGALLGSLLLLARSRHAVAASLAGLAITTFYQYVLASPPPVPPGDPQAYMPILIWAIAIALLVYALRMRRRGVLR